MSTQKSSDRSTSPIAGKRLANRVIWGLEDIVALCREADGECAAVQALAREGMDVALMHRASNLRAMVNAIWRKTVDARHGEYREEGSGP